MTRTDVSFSDTGYFSQLILDYLKAEPALSPLYGLKPDINSFKEKLVQRQKHSIDRRILVDVLRDQYSAINNSKAKANIELLSDNKTYTVCTGHQICLFTGPLYFIYKIASAIVLARQLKAQYPDYNFIPVYWMATEDHDYEEINHINFKGKKMVWDRSTQGFVGDLSVQGISEIIAELKKSFRASAYAGDLIEKLEKAYTSAIDLAAATRDFVNALFSDHGLVIIDANDKQLKALFKTEMESELSDQAVLNCTKEAIEVLAKNYKVQVNPRPLNLFYLKDNKRVRIDYDARKYYLLLDKKEEVTLEWLLSELRSNPERFSPNVMMRPLYQEKILPNLAYIGGGGELAYWFELKDLFTKTDVSFPILFLRNSFLLIDEKSSSLLAKMQLQDTDVFLSKEILVKNFLQKLDSSWNSDGNNDKLREAYESIVDDISKIDPTLEASAKAELQRSQNRLRHLDQKVNKALKLQNETQISRIDTIKLSLFPGGSLQERHDNILEYYLNAGPQLIEQIIDNTDLFNSNFGILRH